MLYEQYTSSCIPSTLKTMDANRGEISTFTPIPMLFLLSHPIYNHHMSMNCRTTKLEHNYITINSDQEKLQKGQEIEVCLI